MFWLIKTTLPVFFSTIIVFFLYRNYNKLENSQKFIYIFCFLWFFLFLFHLFILGPNSPIHYYDNADVSVTNFLYGQNFHVGGNFLHNILSGSDYYGSHGFLTSYLSLERSLFNIFPVWIAYLLHKFILLSFNFFGMYFVLHKVFHFKKVESLFVSSFVTVINPYTLYSTVHHGLGYAALPFAVYFYLFRTNKKHYFLITTFLSILFASSTSPIHSFQALFGGLIISYFIIKPAKPIYFLISTSLFLLIFLINWNEALYGLYEYGQLSSRYQSFESGYAFLSNVGSLDFLYRKTNFCFINCSTQYSPLITILIISFISIIAAFNKNYIKLILLIIVANYIPHFIYFILDIDLLNLKNLKSVNFINFTWYLIFPISILALKIASNNRNNIFNKMSLVFVFFSTIILFSEKFDNAKSVFFEPQKAIYAIKNLTNREWQPNKFFRMVSTNPHEMFHPNFLWAYGLETLDGYTNLIPENYVDFFTYGIRRQEYSVKDKSTANGYVYIHNKPLRYDGYGDVDLNAVADINMLRLSNTAFIASYIKLKEDGIKKISGPEQNSFKLWNTANLTRDINFYLNAIKERKNNFVTPEDIFIYKIDDYSDRAFFPEKILNYEQNLNIREQYKFFSDNYKKNYIFISNNSLMPAKGEILNITKVPNGYEIQLKVFEEGLFVLNNIYLPFWKAYVDGEKVNIIPASNIQMAIYLNKDSKQVFFKYGRTLLREKVLQYISRLKKSYL